MLSNLLMNERLKDIGGIMRIDNARPSQVTAPEGTTLQENEGEKEESSDEEATSEEKDEEMMEEEEKGCERETDAKEMEQFKVVMLKKMAKKEQWALEMCEHKERAPIVEKPSTAGSDLVVKCH